MKSALTSQQALYRITERQSLRRRVKRHWAIYVMLLPAVLWFITFCYVPMYGVTLAFKDFNFKDMLGSPWLTKDIFKYFKQFFNYFMFWDLIRNTLVISVQSLLFGFPAPILLALLLNEVKNRKFKRVTQTITYLPHFVSWVIVVGLLNVLFSPYGGTVNSIRQSMGLSSIFFMNERDMFYPLLIGSRVWKGVGWGSILYLSALSGISPELYEAATIDGASKLRQAQHISLPGIMPTVSIMLILSMGGLLSSGWEQIYLMKTPGNTPLANVIEIYVLEMGLSKGQFGYATAVGIFQSAFALCMVMLSNFIVKKVSENEGLF